jgi:DNA-binding IclR family transcriptional regulator
MAARPLSSVLKCFDLLELIAQANGPMRLADVARASDESRATTYQRLLTLTTAGWVERLADGTYRLSLRACRFANTALEQAGLGERALPSLEKLTERTGETSSLIALENDRIIIAQRVEAHGMLRTDLRVGAEMSFLDSGSGRVWASFGPPGLVDRLTEQGVEIIPPEERAKIRNQGYAVAGGGRTLAGISVIAVPVLGGQGECLFSLSLVGLESRFDPKTAIDDIKATAAEISELLSGGARTACSV